MGPKLATLVLLLLTLFTNSLIVCQLAEDIEEDPYEHFDCSSKNDGLYSLGCGNQFVNCVTGQAYQMNCPDVLVFNEKTQECQESCDDDVEEDIAATTLAAPLVYKDEHDDEGYEEGSGDTEGEYEPQPTTEEPIDFDCNGLENGNYADGCSDVFYTCNNGVVFRRYCPQGTVFNPSQQACDYDCTEAVTTTTQTYVPSDDVVTATTTTTQAPIICQDGQVTSFGMCSSRFNRCQNNTVRSKQCPVNTLFESALVLCVFDLPQCQPVTAPSNPTYNTYGGGSLPSDSVVSPFDENVRLKPKFDRRPKYHHGPYRRPSYGSPLLENPFFIPRHHSGPYHHGGDGHKDNRRRGYWRPAIQSPFSTSFRGRAALDDQFKDYRRARMGKIQYGEARKVEGNKRFLIDDEFEGPEARFVQSDIQRVFPEDRHSKRKLGPREDPDGYKDDVTFDPKDLFGATRRKRSAYYGAQQPGYGQQVTQISSRQAQVNKDCQQYTTPTFLTFGDCFDQFIYCSGNGVNRMAACPIGETFNKALRACSETCGVTNPIVTATDDSTTYSPIVTVPADDQTTGLYGTPSDDTTTDSYGTPSEDETTYSYGKPSDDTTYSPIVTVPADDQTTGPYGTPSDDTTTNSYGTSSDATTRAPVGGRCESVPSGLFAIGCSQKYIQCSHGSAIIRRCASSLYFNEETRACDFRDNVPACQSGYSPTTAPGQDELTTSGYGYGTSDAPAQYGETTIPADDQTTGPYGTPSDDTTTNSYGTSSDETTRAPVGGRCESVPSGLFAIGCSQKYIQCSHGSAITRLCASSLYFNEETQACDFRDNVAACQSGYSPTSAPGQDETTTSGYGYGTSDAPAQYGEATIPAEDTTVVVTSTDAGLVQPLPYVTLEDVLSTTTQATTTFGYDEPSNDYTTTSSYGDETPASDAPAQYGETTIPAEDTAVVVTTDSYNRGSDDNEVQEDDGYGQKCTLESRASTGFCARTYLECTSTGYIEKSCRFGKLFDSHENKCVAKIACGKEDLKKAITEVLSSSLAPIKNRCASVEGVGSFALGLCSTRYVSCAYGASQLEQCASDEVFSVSKSVCVARELVKDCVVSQQPPVMAYYNNNNEPSGFCDGKTDGLYRNERDCSAVLQCFGGTLFEHQSCPSNLAFNEMTGTCDYPQKVRGCENHGQTEGVCAVHGSFIADVDNCSIFYRCVWGRKVVMRCPSGTVFNPALSVCDWPSAVPSCGPATDENSYGDSSSKNDNSGY